MVLLMSTAAVGRCLVKIKDNLRNRLLSTSLRGVAIEGLILAKFDFELEFDL